LDAPEILSPFLTAVRSAGTGTLVRSAALSSLEKFFACQVIHLGLSGVTEAMRAFTASVAKCRHAASESSADSLVLLRMLLAMQAAVLSPNIRVMDDVSVCELMEVGLSLCCQMRLDDNLRRLAESCVTTLVRVLFESLKTMHHGSAAIQGTADPDVHVSVNPVLSATRRSMSDTSAPGSPVPTRHATPVAAPTPTEAAIATRPYGIASLHELLRVLISLCDPHNLHYTDTMRISALNILLAAVEVGGSSIARFTALRMLIVDDLLAHTFQLVNTEKLHMLSITLRLIVAVFDTMRPHLTLQLELFVDTTLKRLSLSDAELLSRATRTFNTTEYRQRLLDTLLRVTQVDELAPTLWLNYDGAIGRRNMVDALIAHLCTEHNGPTGRQCQQVLILFMEFMEARAQSDEDPDVPDESASLMSAQMLRDRKERKRLLHDAACRFNKSPREGVQFLQEHGIIPDETSEDREKALARFFHTTPEIDKAKLGEFLAKKQSQPALEAFISRFDFTGKRIDEAMRMMLESFRLPGEAQQIDRVMETFSRLYFASAPADIATQDATYVLAFSVIMLNTDLHNPQVKVSNRMKIEDYMRNLRGVNNGQDFALEYLASTCLLTTVYNTIRDNEIVMPEEHEGQLGFMYAWREMIRESKDCERMSYCASGQYDRDLFAAFGRNILAMFGSVLEHATNDAALDMALNGIRLCADLSARFDMLDIFDTVVPLLAGLTGLGDHSVDVGVRRFGTLSTEPERNVATTALSVRFGRDYKAEIITIAFFDIIRQHGDRLRDSWTTVVDLVTISFRAAMLPPSLTAYVDITSGPEQIPFKVADPTPAGSRDSSIFSALSNYLMPTYDPEMDPALEEDVSAALNAQQCLAHCQLDEILTGSWYVCLST
ncbi:hypothetical protein THASP1DRAFT_18630, partial [Thamnocephalis sphaerospora]